MISGWAFPVGLRTRSVGWERNREEGRTIIGMFETPFDEGFEVMESTDCPICGKKIEDVFSIVAEKPFTAMSPMGGLTVWGPYDVQKKIICEGHSWVHFKFLHDGSERLVLMNLPEDLKTKYKP